MRGKKQSNGSGQQLEEILTKMLSMFKKKCEGLGIVPNPGIKLTLQNAIQFLKFQVIKTTQIVGPIQIRALMQTLVDLKYVKIKHIDIWKAKIGDQGLRNICRYLQSRQNNVVQVLDLLQNQITSLGCEFLGKVFMLPFTRILKLKLDDNLIGNKGLQNLAIGLRTNSVLTKLSLKYCGIDEKGVVYLQDILANLSTKIRSIKVQGNPLGSKGVYEFLKVIQLNQMLQKVNIADTKLNLLDFKAKNQYVIDQNFIELSQNQAQQIEGEQQNPQKKQQKQQPNLQNVKQIILPANSEQKTDEKKQAQKVAVIKQIKQQKKKQHYKITKSINQQDKSLSANIMRILSGIMRQNLLIRKYDLRFNPISDDAAIILFEIIQQNMQIKDVELNNNVDNTLRQNLDTLMRKRTGRLPKGRKGKSKKTKKKKK